MKCQKTPRIKDVYINNMKLKIKNSILLHQINVGQHTYPIRYGIIENSLIAAELKHTSHKNPIHFNFLKHNWITEEIIRSIKR